MAKAQPKAENPTALDDDRPRTATGTAATAKAGGFPKEQEIDAFSRMLLIRRFEERAGQM